MIAANYTRRLDLFKDSGFDSEICRLYGQSFQRVRAEKFDLTDANSREKINHWADENLSWMLKPLRSRVFPISSNERAISLPVLDGQQLHSDIKPNEMAAYILRICLNFQNGGHKDEILALLKFLVNVDFEYGDLYKELGVSHGFLESGSPIICLENTCHS